MARHLNVRYKTLPAMDVDVTGMTWLSDILRAVKKAFSLTVGYGLIQLVDVHNNHITDVDDIPAKYYKRVKKGGLALTVHTTKRVLDDGETDPSEPASKKQRIDSNLLITTSANFKAFENARFINSCIVSPPQTMLPFPQKGDVQKVYVRQCYKEIFRLLDTEVEKGFKSFAICGTPGIGKSLSFIYILRCLMRNDASRSLNPTKIVYQTTHIFQCFDLEKQTVSALTSQEAAVLVDNPQTLYIIDGRGSPHIPSTCVTLYIALPCSEEYKEFVKQKKPRQWSCPIWTKAELEDCREKCYPTISKESLEERYRVGGGDARFVLATDPYIGVPSVDQSQV
ncbi:hypothetical protein HDU77_006048 [Chytriomyces hyalinus]|nr:hypothetical protein HDU77_006048 [Chytriomyces hyalinus]